jgi:hypothetical protein
MCSPQNKWNIKSTIFLFAGLDGDGLESCCNVLGIEHVEVLVQNNARDPAAV